MKKKTKKYIRIAQHTKKVGSKKVKVRAHIRRTSIPKKKKRRR